MKKYLVLFACLIIIGSISSCKMNTLRGEGKKTISTPSVSSFNAVNIDLSVKADITVQSGTQPRIDLDGYENIIKHIKTEVKNNTLYITSDLGETWTMDCNDITARITLPAMTTLTLSGAPDAYIHGNMTGPDFKLDISGASKVVIDDINVDNFSSDVSGAADIEVKAGAVKNASYEISGAGKIIAFPLQANETTASISGAGKSEVTALTKLSATISGAGTIKYKGHPTVTKEVSGVGTVTDAN